MTPGEIADKLREAGDTETSAPILGLWSGIKVAGGFYPIYKLGCELLGKEVPDTTFGNRDFVNLIRGRLLDRYPWLAAVPTVFTNPAVRPEDVLPFLPRAP